MQTNVDPAQVQQAMAVMMPLFALFALLFYALLIIPMWFALKKAGLSPWLSLLTLVPAVGPLIPLYILAFARWRVVPLPPEYPAYPAQMAYPVQAPGYPPQQGAYPPQVYTQPGVYPPPASPATYASPTTPAQSAYAPPIIPPAAGEGQREL